MENFNIIFKLLFLKKTVSHTASFKIGIRSAILIYSSLLFITFPAFAQDSNILHPIKELEQKLQREPFEIFRIRGSRFKKDLTKRAILKWSDGIPIQVKWKRAKKGGWAVNNQPRYEIAAYEVQKLFLEPEEYVVPPTVGRSLPLDEYREIEPNVKPTFKNTKCVFFCLQYWLEEVTSKKIYDKKRFKSDTTYAKHLGNMNILSYIIKHNDSNEGNFLISKDPANPRVFAVDNGLAFKNFESNRGNEWRKIRVKSLPGKTIERLRKIRKTDLEKTLGVVAQFKILQGQLISMPASESLDEGKGVRVSEEIVQFGLTKSEINGVFNRIKKLLKRVESGKIKTF